MWLNYSDRSLWLSLLKFNGSEESCGRRLLELAGVHNPEMPVELAGVAVQQRLLARVWGEA